MRSGLGREWDSLGRALEALSFDTVRFEELESEAGENWDRVASPPGDVFAELTRPRRWEPIMRQLRELSGKSELMALRPESRDLAIVLGQRGKFEAPETTKRFVQHVRDVLSAL